MIDRNTIDIPLVYLAHQQLFTPFSSDDTFKIPNQLHKPIWMPKPLEEDINTIIHSNCLQIEALLVSSHLHNKDIKNNRGVKNRVTFESKHHEIIQNCISDIQLAVNLLHPLVDLKEFLVERKITNLYPRVLELMRNDRKMPLSDALPSQIMKYFAHVSKLNNVMIMCQELNADLHNCSNHKYIAHQVALLHQAAGYLGQPAVWAKTEIQSHFDGIRNKCSQQQQVASSRRNSVKLPKEEKLWLDKLTRDLYTLSSVFSPPIRGQIIDTMMSNLIKKI